MTNQLKNLDEEMESLRDDLPFMTDEGITSHLKTMAQECGVPHKSVVDQWNRQCDWFAKMTVSE